MPYEPVELIQLSFASGRQGLFQAVSRYDDDQSMHDLVGRYVVTTMDNGVDIALVCAVEPLDALVWGVPEVCFTLVAPRANQVRVCVRTQAAFVRVLRVATVEGSFARSLVRSKRAT